MKRIKEVLTVVAMLAGLVIAGVTGNHGNVFIFLGLFLITLNTFLEKTPVNIYKVLGIIVYIGGLGWAIATQQFAGQLGWGSVFITLIITAIEIGE